MKALSKMTRAELEEEIIDLTDPADGELDMSDFNVEELRDLLRDMRASSEEMGRSAGEAAEPDTTPRVGDNDAPAAQEIAHSDIPDGCITVEAGGPANQAAFWERDTRHPGGEVFLRGGDTGVVYPTPAVRRALGRALREV